MTPIIMAAFSLATAALGAVLLYLALRRGLWILAGVNAVVMAVCVWSVAMDYRIYELRRFMDESNAECAGQPAWKPYQPGMTLCPGQGTTIIIEIPVKDDGHDI